MEVTAVGGGGGGGGRRMKAAIIPDTLYSFSQGKVILICDLSNNFEKRFLWLPCQTFKPVSVHTEVARRTQQALDRTRITQLSEHYLSTRVIVWPCQRFPRDETTSKIKNLNFIHSFKRLCISS